MRWYAIAAPILMTTPLLAQNIVLDDFDSDPNDEAGGPRAVSSAVNANPFGQASDFDVMTGFSYVGINGAAIFNSGIGVEQVGTIVWNNDGAGLNLDAAALNVNGFELDFLQIDQAFQVSILLESFDVIGSSASFSTTIGPVTSLTTYAVGAGDFSLLEGFDFTDIDSVTITFNGGQSSTASLDFILTEFRATVVPSPASVAMLGLGGLMTIRRRR